MSDVDAGLDGERALLMNQALVDPKELRHALFGHVPVAAGQKDDAVEAQAAFQRSRKVMSLIDSGSYASKQRLRRRQ